MSRLHPVFHVVKLLPAPPDPFPGCHSHPPPPPTVIEGEPQYEVESILDSHLSSLKYHIISSLVPWKGSVFAESSWVDDSDVKFNIPLSFNPSSISTAVPLHAPPQHRIPSSQTSLVVSTILITQGFITIFPHIFSSIWCQTIGFSLLWLNYPLHSHLKLSR
ncbi:hypothetical protein L208DRAFT_1467338 [Tricholoma matsutake]|nr:hypothetical protein L208DRAFT_1467338 [Tricholoma matsutake 945]